MSYIDKNCSHENFNTIKSEFEKEKIIFCWDCYGIVSKTSGIEIKTHSIIKNNQCLDFINPFLLFKHILSFVFLFQSIS